VWWHLLQRAGSQQLVTDVMSEFEVFEFLEKMAELLG